MQQKQHLLLTGCLISLEFFLTLEILGRRFSKCHWDRKETKPPHTHTKKKNLPNKQSKKQSKTQTSKKPKQTKNKPHPHELASPTRPYILKIYKHLIQTERHYYQPFEYSQDQSPKSLFSFLLGILDPASQDTVSSYKKLRDSQAEGFQKILKGTHPNTLSVFPGSSKTRELHSEVKSITNAFFFFNLISSSKWKGRFFSTCKKKKMQSSSYKGFPSTQSVTSINREEVCLVTRHSKVLKT